MIGLIVPGTLKYCPYIKYYEDLFKENNIPYEILSWNKVGIDEKVAHSFECSVKDNQLLKKTLGYFRYRRWVLKICKKKQYKTVIVFTLAPALLLFTFLLENYKEKYILDIRDDTILRKVFGKKLGKVIDNAKGIVSSSREFDKWIGKHTVLGHNVDKNLLEKGLNIRKNEECSIQVKTNDSYRIMFAGSMLEWEINLQMLKKFKNNQYFYFVFHAPDNAGKIKMVEYCAKNNVNNVQFYGAYQKNEIHDIYRKEADWANIIRAESVVNRNAMPNKFYDAMVSGVPVIVLSHNKAISDYVKKYYLGLIFEDLDDLSCNFIYKIYDFNRQQFEMGRIQFLTDTLKEINTFESEVIKWIERLK